MKTYNENIEKLTLENENFRKVICTSYNLQLVLMSLLPGEDIGAEIHDVDQFFRIEKGVGKAIVNETTYELKDGSVLIVPSGSKHNIINGDKGKMKLYTIYTPPHHKDLTIHKTRHEAENDNEQFDGETTI